MAKSLDKEPTPPEGNEPPPAGPSLLLIAALGDHAEQQGLVQAEGEEEIAFAVRCIEKLGQLVTAMDGNIRALEGESEASLRQQLGLEKELTAKLTEELKAANRRLASQRGATTKAKAKIVEMEEAGKPRALGPVAPVFDDDGDQINAVDFLLTAIDGAEEIVLAFSDGKSELKGIKPRKVSAEAFRFTRGRLHFIEGPLEVTGPGGEGAVTTLAGVALLIDGEQVAWSPLSQPLPIGAGQTMNLAGSVIFG